VTRPATRRRRIDESLSLADLRDAVFSSSSPRTRSYDKSEVDAFVAEAQREIARIRAENRELREKLERGPTKRELAAELEQLMEDLARAEQHARDVQAELEHAWTVASEGRPSPSDGPSEFIVLAQRFADQHVRDAEREAEAVYSAARTEADKMLSEAHLLASTIDSDARARHTEAIRGLFHERTAALAEIDRLTEQLDRLHEALRGRMTREVPELLPPDPDLDAPVIRGPAHRHDAA
jgi:cell division septum initiation protein DivIVA